MSLLALSMVTAPYRGLLIGDRGSRTPVSGLDEARPGSTLDPAVYVDAYGAEIGLRAVQASEFSSQGLFWFGNQSPAGTSRGPDGMEWRNRDLYSLIFRRALLAASQGASLPELALITPPSTLPAGRRDLVAAALIAGAPSARVIDVGELLPEDEHSGGVRVLLIELDHDHLRIQLCEMSDARTLTAIQKASLPEWSGNALARRIAGLCGVPTALTEAAIAQIFPLLKDWGAGGDHFALLPNPAGPPCPLFVPASLLSKLADALVDCIEKSISEERLADIFRIRLQGPLTFGLESRLRARAGAAAIASDSSAALLDMTDDRPIQPRLSGSVFTDTLVSSIDGLSVFRLGGRLAKDRPLALANYTTDAFPGRLYEQPNWQGRFAVCIERGATRHQLQELTIPPLFQGRSHLRFGARVCGETKDFLLLQSFVGFADNTTLTLYDFQSERSETIDPRVVGALAALEKPKR